MTLVDASTGEIVADLSPDEARALTESIKGSASRLYQLVSEAHRGRAHRALGYESWEAYCRAEFDMTKQNAYLLLDQARVIGELAESSALDPSEVPLSGRASQDVKGDLPGLKERITRRTETEVDADATPAEQVETKRRIIEEEVERTRTERRTPPPVKSFDPGRDQVDDEPGGIDLDEDLVDDEAAAIEQQLDQHPDQVRHTLRNAVLRAKEAMATVVADIDPVVAASLVEPGSRTFEINTIGRQIEWLNDYHRALSRAGLTVMEGGR